MRYMPPESFDGMVSPAWDVWSLGILVMEALTGQKPFEATSQQQVIRLILTQEPIIPKGLPLPYDEVIRHCLIKDHHTRWSAEQVLEVVRQHQRAIGTRQPKFTSRIHTKLWWATGAVLIVLVIVLGILSKSGGRKPEPLRSESVQITDEQHQPRENSSTTAGARPLPHQEPKRPVAGSVPASEMQPAIRATLPKQLELEPKRSGVQVQCAGVKSFGFYLYASGGAMIGGGSCQPGGTYTFSVPPGNYRLSQPNPVQFFPLEITVDEGRTTEVTPPVGHVAFSGFEVPVKDTFGARTEKSEYLTLYRMGGQRDRDEWTWRCLLGTICVYDIAPGNYTAEFQFVNKRVSVAVAPEQTTTIQPPR
jgi:hypothetical protein